MPWNASHPAVVVEPPGSLPVTLIRHDGYPYEETWDENATGWSGLFDIANRYLALVNTRLSLPTAWLNDLQELSTPDPRPQTSVHWLRDLTDPRHSFWVERHAGLDAPSRPRTGTVLDRTAVLVAGLCRLDGSPFYGGQGLKILVQTGPHQDGVATVRIAGVCSTLPAPVLTSIEVETFVILTERIAAAFALPEEVELVDVGVSFPRRPTHGDQFPIIFAKTAPASEYRQAKYGRGRHAEDDYSDDYSYEGTSYLLVMRVNPGVSGGLEPLLRRPLIAFADADVFVQDPVSSNGADDFTKFRPSRSWTVLDAARVNVALGNLPPGAGGLVQLVDPDPNNPPDPDFRVLNSRLVDPPLPDDVPKQVPSSVHAHARTNLFAAVNAFYHTSDLFKRMRQYGLPPDAYFRFVTRPVDVRYRAAIIPGFGDGRTVNAQVRWTLRPDAAGGAWAKGTIEVRYALGDLESAVGRLPANLPSAVERSPLGLASDPRWCWHEACHVLLTAAVGDLEFRFAHSAGDAMAAILSDPQSQLASDASGALANSGPWRGVTFPWVFIPRRHDRTVRDGFSWTGALYHREMYFAPPGLSDKRGYWAEQILSSSLFRLYRAIGGDSEATSGGQQVPAKVERQNAADYVVYLIMRAIESLGASAATASTEPHHFVDALRKADTATASAAGPGGYVGGTIHKVVQWAFERQGLYAEPGPSALVAGPEDLSTVDLHIQDLRPQPDGPYSPIDLRGNAWRADPDAITVTASFFSTKRKIRVKVQNRGRTAATKTRVDVWVAPVTGGVIPSYPDAQWVPLGADVKNVPGASGGTPGQRTFGPFSWMPPSGTPREYAILTAASCDADRSNIDPATGYPCLSVTGGPIQVLVGCDNNLGLTTVVA